MHGEENVGNMLNLQILDITWKKVKDTEFLPIIKFYNTSEKTISNLLLTSYSFNFALSKDKFCTGYYKDGELIPCKFNNLSEDNSYSQCNYCERMQGFKSSFIFGDLSHERSQEILSKDYYIYLAYFEPGLLKIGTANIERSSLRLVEQDALIFSFIAKDSGYTIQKLEHIISKKFGITETVKSSHKLKHLSKIPNLNYASELINSKYNQIKSNLDSEHLTSILSKIDIIDLNNTNSFYYPNESHLVKDLNLFGSFLGLRGRYLIIENNETEIMLDINTLKGRYIESYIDDYQYNIYSDQLSLI